jgi:hypothetical protein
MKAPGSRAQATEGENAMPEWEIDRLSLEVWNAHGHEHRVQGIAARAAALIGERLVTDGRTRPGVWSARIPAVALQPVAVDLSGSGDEACALLVAEAVTAAIRMQAEG